MTKIEQRVAQHNHIVSQQIRRSYADLQPYAKGLLRKAPNGYTFTVSHKLVKKVGW